MDIWSGSSDCVFVADSVSTNNLCCLVCFRIVKAETCEEGRQVRGVWFGLLCLFVGKLHSFKCV